MIFAADGGGEVEVPAVGTPATVTGFEIPASGEVDRLSAARRTDVEIPWPAVIQLLLNDHVGAEGSRVRQELAVRRIADVAVDVAVPGELSDLAVQGRGPEVGFG